MITNSFNTISISQRICSLRNKVLDRLEGFETPQHDTICSLTGSNILYRIFPLINQQVCNPHDTKSIITYPKNFLDIKKTYPKGV